MNENLIRCSFPDLSNHLSFTPLLSYNHSFHHPVHPLLPFSSYTVSPLLFLLLFLNLWFTSSPQLSFLPSCLPACPSFHPHISPSFLPLILSLQEMVSFPVQGVAGVYSLSQTKRSVCESSKNTKKKRKADKNQKLTLIRTHALYLRCSHAQRFSDIQLRCFWGSRGSNAGGGLTAARRRPAASCTATEGEKQWEPGLMSCMQMTCKNIKLRYLKRGPR